MLACRAVVLASGLMIGCGSAEAGGLLDSQAGAGGSAGVAGSGGAGGVGGSSGGTAGSAGAGVGGSAGVATGGTGGQGPCDFTGTWASYLEIDVAWAATTVLQAGSDRIRVWLLGDRQALAAEQATEVVKTCGISLPDFQSNFLGGNEKFGMWFPGEVFDLGGIPTFRLNFSGPSAVGSQLASEPVALLIGHTMQDPLTGPWPTLGQVKASDPDADTRPGLSAFASQGNGYFRPPTDALKLERADVLWIVSRTIATLVGTVDSCDELVGTAEVPRMGGQSGLQSHIIGCIKGNGAECTDTETEFLDTNRPDFQPASTSRFTSKRVPAATTCAEVRGLFQ